MNLLECQFWFRQKKSACKDLVRLKFAEILSFVSYCNNLDFIYAMMLSLKNLEQTFCRQFRKLFLSSSIQLNSLNLFAPLNISLASFTLHLTAKVNLRLASLKVFIANIIGNISSKYFQKIRSSYRLHPFNNEVT